jgi:hypothetical protein
MITFTRRLAVFVCIVGLAVCVPTLAHAHPNLLVREMTCVADDGTTSTFTGEFVISFAPMWRSVSGVSGADPVGFNWRGVTVVDPDGTVVASFGKTQGIEHHLDLVTCNFTIPIGPNVGRQAYLEGFFVPAN